MTANERLNLYDLSPARLQEVLRQNISPPFRASQIAEWMYGHGVESFDAMSNIPKDERRRLANKFALEFPKVVERTGGEPPPAALEDEQAAAPETQKYLFELADGNRIEAVYMPMGDRTSICLSSQAGCAVGCTFCVTGFFGAGRNLMPSEMIGESFTVRREHEIPFESLNVVFMGMGEPLLNLEHVLPTLDILYTHIAPKRITLSTAGIIPGIEELAKLERRPNLAVSINAPDQKRREEIMPITKAYPLDDLLSVLRRYPLEKGREITVEYVLLAGYNDSPSDAASLAGLLRGIHAKVNAIPFNEDPHLPPWMKRPSEKAIDAFVEELVRQGTHVTVRRSKGREIAAACGQLRGRTEATRRTASRKANS